MSIAACIIDLYNSAWIMISVAMICFTVILCKCIPIWSRLIKTEKIAKAELQQNDNDQV